MRVYIACLASYNAGVLHGEWIDMDGMDADGFNEAVAAMLRRSPHPNVTVECPRCGGTGRVHRDDPSMAGLTQCGECGGALTVPSAEEWVVHDYDGLPDMGEHPDIDRLIEVAEAIAEHGQAMRLWLANTGDPEGFEDAYRGTADSWEDFAAQLLEDTGALDGMPENLRRYFDLAAYASDLKAGGWWAERDTDGQLHFFSE